MSRRQATHDGSNAGRRDGKNQAQLNPARQHGQNGRQRSGSPPPITSQAKKDIATKQPSVPSSATSQSSSTPRHETTPVACGDQSSQSRPTATKGPSTSAPNVPSQSARMPHEESPVACETKSSQTLSSQSAESSHKKTPVEHKAGPTQPQPTTTKPPNTSTHTSPKSRPPYCHSSSVDGGAGNTSWHQQEPLRQRSRSFHFPWQSQSRVSVCS